MEKDLKKSKHKTINRRLFLKSSVVAASALSFHIVPYHVLGRDGIVSPGRKLNIAAIGLGNRGIDDLTEMKDENIVALCEVDQRRFERAVNLFPGARRFRDFRNMLETMDKQIDAVCIATPDHNHFVTAMAAMKHGKHVYCEKPLAHSVVDLRLLRQEAKKRNIITQMGNQGHAYDSIRTFYEWIRDG
jgi:predicted dehydrogenase